MVDNVARGMAAIANTSVEELTNIGGTIGISGDRYYEGIDLSVKFSSEIASSPYLGNVWAWIKGRITANNYNGIHVNDFIPFVTTNNVTIKACVAGIDTYYRYGDSQVGHHIDFISRDCWPTTVKMNNDNYNNGLIPVETMSGDGSTTAFVLTRQMTGVNTITVGGSPETAFTYDFATSTVTFDVAPATGTNNIIITGIGTQHPWLASNAYAYLNSIAMQVPNGTGFNPAILQVDYTTDGVWYRLPAELKNVIVEKRALLPQRYSATGVLTTDNNFGWANAGKLWLPSEMEITGCNIWGDAKYGTGGFVQYPIFANNMNRVKGLGNGGSRYDWWTISAHSGNSTFFVYVYYYGFMNSYSASRAFGAPVCFRIS